MTVYLAFGPNGSGKSSFALSGTGNKWYAEFDPGSLDRTGIDIAEANIEPHFYHPPLQSLLDMGSLDLASVGRGAGGVQIAYKLSGWKEMFWDHFITDYMKALTEGDFQDFIIDTNKMEWEMCRNSFRQRIQEESDLDEKRRLSRLDYQEPNNQQTQLIQGVKGRGKNYIMVAHEAEIWAGGEPTGRYKPDGWREAEDLADITLRFSIRNKRPVGTIHKAAAGGLDLLDMEIVEPTIEKMDKLIKSAALLRRQGVPLLGSDGKVMSYEDIVATAEMMG